MTSIDSKSCENMTTTLPHRECSREINLHKIIYNKDGSKRIGTCCPDPTKKHLIKKRFKHRRNKKGHWICPDPEENGCDWVSKKSTKSSSSAAEHIRRKHIYADAYHCDFCTVVFSASSNLRNHYNNIHTISNKKIVWKCSYDGCKKTYKSKLSSRVHYSKKHLPYKDCFENLTDDGLYKYKCSACCKLFKNESGLGYHLPNCW